MSFSPGWEILILEESTPQQGGTRVSLDGLLTCQEVYRSRCYDVGMTLGPADGKPVVHPSLSMLNKGLLVTAMGHSMQIVSSLQDKGI